MRTATPGLWAVSVATGPAAEEAVAEALESLLGETASVYVDAETGGTTVSAYLRQKPDWPSLRRELLAQVSRLRRLGLDTLPGRVFLTRLKPQNWAESWKKHIKPFAVGSKLLIKTTWSRRRPRPGQLVVVLDPGLSFGTGQHPTTQFCLRRLAAHRDRRAAQSLLDVGTGSGILAIAAVRLGYEPVEALDIDPEAIRVASANARSNGVSGCIRFFRGDLMQWPQRAKNKFWIICANLTADLLVKHRQAIVERLAPKGVLVLAGILRQEFPRVRQVYEDAGLMMGKRTTQGEWSSGEFFGAA